MWKDTYVPHKLLMQFFYYIFNVYVRHIYKGKKRRRENV